MTKELQNQKVLTRDDIGIYFYFTSYEYADGWIYIGDSVYQNTVYNLEIDSQEYGDACDEYLKDMLEGKTQEEAEECLDDVIAEFSFLRC